MSITDRLKSAKETLSRWGSAIDDVMNKPRHLPRASLPNVGQPRYLLPLGLVALFGAGIASYASEQWNAVIKVLARTAGIDPPPSDVCYFGATTNANASRDYDSDGVLDAPAQPSTNGVIDIFQEADNAGEPEHPFQGLMKNYISVTNANQSFRGVIEYDGPFSPTSAAAVVTGLPGKWVMITFSDDLYGQVGGARNGAHNVKDGKEVDIGTNTLSYILTPVPVTTSMSAQPNAANSNNTDVALNVVFYCYNAVPNLEVYASTSMLTPFTDKVGELPGTNGTYSATVSNITFKQCFFQPRIPNP